MSHSSQRPAILRHMQPQAMLPSRVPLGFCGQSHSHSQSIAAGSHCEEGQQLMADFYRYEEVRASAGAGTRPQPYTTSGQSTAESAACRGERALGVVLRQPSHVWTDMAPTAFEAFYNFAFAACRDPGRKHLPVVRAVALWQRLLRGRFRLLDSFCSFVEGAPKDVVSEDTWRQVLEFSRTVCETLSNFDAEGAWAVLLDEFVESVQAQRKFRHKLPPPRPSPPLWHSCSGDDSVGTPAMSAVSPVAGSKRRQSDVEGLATRLAMLSRCSEGISEQSLACPRKRSRSGVNALTDHVTYALRRPSVGLIGVSHDM